MALLSSWRRRLSLSCGTALPSPCATVRLLALESVAFFVRDSVPFLGARRSGAPPSPSAPQRVFPRAYRHSPFMGDSALSPCARCALASISARWRLILVRDCTLSFLVREAPWTHSVRDGAVLPLRHGASFLVRIRALLSWAMVPSFHVREALWTQSVCNGALFLVRDGALPYQARRCPPLSCAMLPPFSHATALSSIVRNSALTQCARATAPNSLHRGAFFSHARQRPFLCAKAPHSRMRRRPLALCARRHGLQGGMTALLSCAMKLSFRVRNGASFERDHILTHALVFPGVRGTLDSISARQRAILVLNVASSIVHDTALLYHAQRSPYFSCTTARLDSALSLPSRALLPSFCVRRKKSSSLPILVPSIAPRAIGYSSSAPCRYGPRCIGDLSHLKLFSFVHVRRRAPFHFFSRATVLILIPHGRDRLDFLILLALVVHIARGPRPALDETPILPLRCLITRTRHSFPVHDNTLISRARCTLIWQAQRCLLHSCAAAPLIPSSRVLVLSTLVSTGALLPPCTRSAFLLREAPPTPLCAFFCSRRASSCSLIPCNAIMHLVASVTLPIRMVSPGYMYDGGVYPTSCTEAPPFPPTHNGAPSSCVITPLSPRAMLPSLFFTHLDVLEPLCAPSISSRVAPNSSLSRFSILLLLRDRAL
ncbi:hypothetical protein B0H13DRAFT_2316662 [Mycena leptocephala]|nr:hypothetical protein B0H13DRAFT_2316662 [Mycena leptocephala]